MILIRLVLVMAGMIW